MKDKSYLLILLNDIEGLRKLIADGEDINMQNLFGRTALMNASFENKPEIVKLLVEAGADLNLKDRWGGTALDYAKERNHTEIIELITEIKKPKVIKPTSTVIQINTTENLSNLITTALCEDGSVWRYANEKWVCILEAPSKENK